MKWAGIGLAAGAIAASPALANGNGDEQRSERAEGAPGQVCKQEAPPTQPAFRDCVTAAAHERGQGEQTQEQRQQAREQRQQARQQAKAQRRQARQQAKQQRQQARQQAKQQRQQAKQQPPRQP